MFPHTCNCAEASMNSGMQYKCNIGASVFASRGALIYAQQADIDEYEGIHKHMEHLYYAPGP